MIKKKLNSNETLDVAKVFMFSSVHNWMDTRIYNKEVASLIKNGKNIEYYAIGNQKDSPVIEGLEVHFMPQRNKWFRPFKWFFLLKKALISDAKFYHFHDAELLCLTSIIRKKKPDAIIIYDMHEYFAGQISTKDWIPFIIRRPITSLVCVLEKKMMSFCDGVIYAEKSYKHYFPSYKGITEEVLNYPLQVELKEIPKESIFTLIYVGDITADRNIIGMIDMAIELKKREKIKFQLKLIGPIAESLKKKVEKKIIDYGLEKQILWYGRIPYDDIWEHYSSAHVGLCLLKPIPNYKNSMATKLYEYMAAGIPILASDFPDWKSFLKENKCGLVADPFNTVQIVQCIEELAHDEQLTQELGRNGRKAFETKYNWENESEKFHTFYKYLEKKEGLLR